MPLIKRLQTGAVVALVLAALIGGLQGASPASALVGDITTFQDPTGQYPVGFNSITAGSDGNVWFSTTSRESRFQEICDTDGFDRDSLGRLSPSGELTFFTEPDHEGALAYNFWVRTAQVAEKIQRTFILRLWSHPR